MYTHETQIRVRYGETDKMGYLYYGNYAQFYEVGRVEAIRNLGFSYKQMEDEGVMLPVLDLKSTFIKPAYYDELLTVKVSVTEMPTVRIHFSYEIYNPGNELINIGETTLVFFDMERRKPIKAPDYVIERLKAFFA
ncbi:MAG: acyl-CoA thioesterase [Sphingobacteriales bacterium]|nr:MAG: acyl-CoA thioesterase [Sphingobacteriales bacterium]